MTLGTHATVLMLHVIHSAPLTLFCKRKTYSIQAGINLEPAYPTEQLSTNGCSPGTITHVTLFIVLHRYNYVIVIFMRYAFWPQ